MIGSSLTGLDANERAEIRLRVDTSDPQTVFVIKNGGCWVDLEVGRIAHQWEMAGYQENHAVMYAWVSLCLVEMRNVNAPDDKVAPPRGEEYRTRTGALDTRIPMEWIVRMFGKQYPILDELSTAIFSYNHLTQGERKNWTWPAGSNTPETPANFPASTEGKTGEGSGGAADGVPSADSGSK